MQNKSNQSEVQGDFEVICPKCGNDQWNSQIIQNSENPSFCGTFLRYLCCWPWAMGIVSFDNRYKNYIISN